MTALPQLYKAMVRREDSRHFQIVGLPAGMSAPPKFGLRIEAERWLLANLGELKRLQQRKSRKCMCCGAAFDSEGIHNRLCANCRKRPDVMGDPCRPYIARSA